MDNETIQLAIRDRIIVRYIDKGYTVKHERGHLIRMWNREHKLYLCYYGGEWCVAEADNYTPNGKFLEVPRSAIDLLSVKDMEYVYRIRELSM